MSTTSKLRHGAAGRQLRQAGLLLAGVSGRDEASRRGEDPRHDGTDVRGGHGGAGTSVSGADARAAATGSSGERVVGHIR